MDGWMGWKEGKERKRREELKETYQRLKLSVERDQCFSSFNLSRPVCGPIVGALHIARATHDSSHRSATPRLPCSMRRSHWSRPYMSHHSMYKSLNIFTYAFCPSWMSYIHPHTRLYLEITLWVAQREWVKHFTMEGHSFWTAGHPCNWPACTCQTVHPPRMRRVDIMINSRNSRWQINQVTDKLDR